MSSLATNAILAAVWAALTGGFTLAGLATGFALGYVVLWLVQPLMGESRYSMRVLAWIKLVALFLYELVLSSLAVAVDILTPGHRARPAIIDVPLAVRSEAGLLLITNLITLTPGTLSLDVSADRRTLRVHAMFADDPDALRASLKTMERWVIDAVEDPE